MKEQTSVIIPDWDNPEAKRLYDEYMEHWYPMIAGVQYAWERGWVDDEAHAHWSQIGTEMSSRIIEAAVPGYQR